MGKQVNADNLPDARWRAILNNDASYDGQFFYAVQTTGIFCRPSCKSRPPRKENIQLFETAEQAVSAKFRPCKRCRPTGQRLPDEEWIALITEYMDKNYRQALTLKILSDISHGSPYHLLRTFKRIKGITPVMYLQQKRIDHAKELLVTSDKSIAEIGRYAGMPNTPYFITLFKKKTGLTPAGYRQIQTRNLEEVRPNGK
ncbi:bifunctional transcriptional activator/DNA repair enzyme AdaA [Paenibacillus solisilvae]|uniref:Bifunctional transcriptional activator/DNA repair enzyme AdaA n=1 Tax=Paenibacillus solisilvae TaxID=2486751 RepID=A0ABW0W6K1_9BACL